EEIADAYNYVIWRNLALRGHPTLETLFTDLLAFFRHSQKKENRHFSTD
ncbi:MAG: hypothetical protein GVY17_00935, partial [Cyanobacteria bacterium]|nr:hypothetical protein [Cyanobacteria bacterium GSL.Bin21]